MHRYIVIFDICCVKAFINNLTNLTVHFIPAKGTEIGYRQWLHFSHNTLQKKHYFLKKIIESNDTRHIDKICY